ncbi:polysaccharide biosynthesis protein [Rhodopirellula maiorica SM1]|uniref:Polysaccharide biosynthesis protein n=1 Tax=Rhodopirellula maiorica SM1 TaxID=1265738 RepID=M5RQM2_9BACT|nr:oligosaccharide flippase family protein [Rhodopirellula maiorica]EMI21511.1 polysaccharide biosynthesis protein [Rhodopirellula maiorica SM1]
MTDDAIVLRPFIHQRLRPALRNPATFASLTTVGLFATSLLLKLVSNLVLSRLVLPDVFGLMALVTIAVMGLTLLSDVGLAPAVVQHSKGSDPDFLRTAWTIQAIRGLAIWVGCWIAAPLVAKFYSEPILVMLIPIVGFTAAIEGFASTGILTVQRRLKPTAMISLNVVSQLLGAVVTCSLAFFYPTVWSLVVGALAASVCRTLGSFLLPSEIRHRFRWNPEFARELFHFGKWIFVSTAATFFAMQVDRMMLGRIGSLETLGLYTLATTIAMLPVLLITHIGDYVMFPLLAHSARETPEKLAAEVAPVRGRMLGFGLIMNVGVFAVAPIFFGRLYGVQYADAGRLCQWMVFAGWGGVVSGLAVQTLKAIGDVRAMATGKMIRFIATIPCTLIGFTQFGLEGFIVGYTLGIVPEHLWNVWKLWKTRLSFPLQDLAYTLAFTAAIVVLHLFGTTIISAAILVCLVSGITLAAVYWIENKTRGNLAAQSA